MGKYDNTTFPWRSHPQILSARDDNAPMMHSPKKSEECME